MDTQLFFVLLVKPRWFDKFLLKIRGKSQEDWTYQVVKISNPDIK